MKKALSLLTATAMAATLLAGCGSGLDNFFHFTDRIAL